MDVFDRYFRTLRVFLPHDQRDDIIRELSEEVRSMAADKEAALGRAPNDDEQTAIVSHYGHPLLLAARYRPQRYLIGPVIFPYYASVVKVVLAIIVAVHVVGAAVMLANGAGLSQAGGVLEAAVAAGLKAFGWITLLAAWLDLWLARSRVLERSQPRAEPPIEQLGRVVARGAVTAALDRRHSGGPAIWSREPSVTGLVTSVVISVWWLAGLRVPQLFFGPGAANLEWGPAMDRLFPVLVAAQVMLLIDQTIRLIGSDDARLSRITRLVWLVSGWALIGLVATSDHQWMLWQGEAAARGNRVIMRLAGREISLAQFVNYVWSAIFIGVAVASAWQTLRGMLRWFRGGARPAAAACVVLLLTLVPTVAVTLAAQALPMAGVPLGSADIHKILVDRIDVQHQSLGIVVGIVGPDGKRRTSYGVFDTEDPRAVAGDTIFEIGSVTKVFTSWVLADMARPGELSLTDAVAQHLPASVALKPTGEGRAMTLTDLATHTAGLPFWPSNVPATGNTIAALAGYTVDELFQFIATVDAPPDIGTRWAYSNIDAGLLGVLISRRAGSTYDALLTSRISGPLGLTSTAVSVSSSMRRRLAPGHTAQLKKAAPWNVPALAGGGSLLSSVDDLLEELAAFGDPTSPLGAALPTMLSIRRQAPGFQQALGWMVLAPAGGDELLFHDGQTLGFASAIAYEPKTRTGVVVLSNAAAGVGDIARHVLRPAIPLAKPAAPAPHRTEVQINPKRLDVYAGQYAPAPGTVFVVSHEGDFADAATTGVAEVAPAAGKRAGVLRGGEHADLGHLRSRGDRPRDASAPQGPDRQRPCCKGATALERSSLELGT